MPLKFVITTGRAGKFGFSVMARNGRTIVAGKPKGCATGVPITTSGYQVAGGAAANMVLEHLSTISGSRPAPSGPGIRARLDSGGHTLASGSTETTRDRPVGVAVGLGYPAG